MKKLTHIIKTGVFVLLASLNITSCVDGNDWETVDGNRLFGTTSFSVSPAAITAEVNWDATPKTDYYIIEASLEQMDNDTPMGSASGSIVYGEDKSINKSPYTLTGLQGETTYYLRIKSVATGKESRWIYLEDATFKTDKEEILGTVPSENITEESVLLTWQAGLEVTHVIITAGVENPEQKNITAEEAAAGQKLIDGLLPGTEYTISIYNGEVKRGETTVMTVMPVMVEFSSVQATKTSVTLAWDPEAIQTGTTTVSHYAWCEGNRTPSSSDNYTALTAEQISQGQLEITGFEPSTTYTVALMRGTYVRAMTSFTTSKGIPSNYTKIAVSNVAEWNDALTNEAGVENLALLLTGDIDLSNGTKEIPSSIHSLLIWGADANGEKSGNMPNIKVQGLKFNGTFSQIELYNLHLYNTGTATNNGNYIIDQATGTTGNITNLLMESCKFSATRGIIRIRKEGAGRWDNCTFKNCIFAKVGDYGIFTFDSGALTTFGAISLVQSTLDNTYKIMKSAISDYTINIDQCTIFGAGTTLIEGPSSGTILINISKSLFGGITSQAYNSANSISAAGIAQTEAFRTSNCPFAQNRIFGEMIEGVTDDQLFTNPTDGDFTVLVDEYKAYGDQRWNK